MQVSLSIRLDDQHIDPKDPAGSVCTMMWAVVETMQDQISGFREGSRSMTIRAPDGSICGVLKLSGKMTLPKVEEVVNDVC